MQTEHVSEYLVRFNKLGEIAPFGYTLAQQIVALRLQNQTLPSLLTFYLTQDTLMSEQQNFSEAQTRQQLIDEQLRQAGWSHEKGNLVEDLGIPSQPRQSSKSPAGYTAGSQGAKIERADYALLGATGSPLAIVEAKRVGRDPLAGKRQAADY